MLKDLVITSIDNYGWNEIKIWARSLRESGYDGDAVVLCYRTPDESLYTHFEKYNISAYQIDFNYDCYPINHKEQPQHKSMVCRNRFFHMWWFLTNSTEKYRWVISTDARDVVFQRNPCEWLNFTDPALSDSDIVASSEAQFYKNEPWNAEDQSNTFGPIVFKLLMENKIVRNAGVITVRGDKAANLFLNIYFTSKHHTGAAGDQAAYNLLLSTLLSDVTWTTTHESYYACQIGTTIDPHKPFHKETAIESLPYYDELTGLVYTSNSRLFTIVHQWDRDPKLKSLIEMRYND